MYNVHKIRLENAMRNFVVAGSGLGCPTSVVLGWPEEAPGVHVGAASLGWQ